jgi:hypothetical protein
VKLLPRGHHGAVFSRGFPFDDPVGEKQSTDLQEENYLRKQQKMQPTL